MSANDVTLPFGVLQDQYYSLAAPRQPQPPAMRSAAWACSRSLATLLLGVFIGWLMFAGDPQPQTFHWLKVPGILRFGGHGDRSTRLYTSDQTDKFMHLQRRIDDEFQKQLNDVDAVVFDPFRLSLALMERIDREFDAFLRHLESDESSEDTEAEDAEVSMWSLLKSPTVHVEENETEMVVTCNFAGMDTENVNVDLKGQQLDISAWHRHDAGGDESGPVISASTYFSRTIIVPPGVRSEDVKATMDGHALRVLVRKPQGMPEEPQTVLIQNKL
jgi:HSP20 family molecular chaperone IbpA